MEDRFASHHLAIVQTVLAEYRVPFFNCVADKLRLSISILAGQPAPRSGIRTTDFADKCFVTNAHNYYMNTPVGPICWQSGIVQWLERVNPDVLIIEANPRILSTRVAIAWMHYHHRKVIGWGLGMLPRTSHKFHSQARELLMRSLVKPCDALIGYSSKAKEDYIRLGAQENRIFVAHNAIDNSESEFYLLNLGRVEEWRDSWRNSLGLREDLPVVLFVGRLIREKRISDLINACSSLSARCQLLIVGDGPERISLEHLAQTSETKIVFAGHLNGEELAKCFIASDLFALPGAGGLAVHQAMSFGKAVLVSFGDGTERDLVQTGVNGQLFELGNVGDLRAKLSDLLADPTYLNDLGEKSLTIVRDQINIDAMSESFVRAIHYVMVE